MQRAPLFRRHGIVAAFTLAFAGVALADHATRPATRNIVSLSHSEHAASFFGVTAEKREVSSDLAFWGSLAIHGNFDGFRVIDISAPGRPVLLSHVRCNGDQGDIFVWQNIVVRAWNSPAPAGRFCAGQPVEAGFEGVHVFDIRNPAAPALVGQVELSARTIPEGCGSHALTGVADRANNRLVIYSNNSVGRNLSACDAIDIVLVPLDNPAGAFFLRKVPLFGGSLGSNNGCHDAGVILGHANLLACASGHAANVFSIGAPFGGTLEDPAFLYTVEEQDGLGNKVGVQGRWNSAAFTWDGRVLVLGWQPGGGIQPECEADDPDIKKSLFFYDADTGAKLGQWVLPRPQSDQENCSIHNFNIAPLRDRYVLVTGNYQAGTWAVDFTDPANPVTVAWSDPPPLGLVTTPTGTVMPELGGAWSSYWFNGFIYESEITKGLNVFRLNDPRLATAIRLSHLNPQTQEFTIR